MHMLLPYKHESWKVSEIKKKWADRVSTFTTVIFQTIEPFSHKHFPCHFVQISIEVENIFLFHLWDLEYLSFQGKNKKRNMKIIKSRIELIQSLLKQYSLESRAVKNTWILVLGSWKFKAPRSEALLLAYDQNKQPGEKITFVKM